MKLCFIIENYDRIRTVKSKSNLKSKYMHNRLEIKLNSVTAAFPTS